MKKIFWVFLFGALFFSSCHWEPYDPYYTGLDKYDKKDIDKQTDDEDEEKPVNRHAKFNCLAYLLIAREITIELEELHVIQGMTHVDFLNPMFNLYIDEEYIHKGEYNKLHITRPDMISGQLLIDKNNKNKVIITKPAIGLLEYGDEWKTVNVNVDPYSLKGTIRYVVNDDTVTGFFEYADALDSNFREMKYTYQQSPKVNDSYTISEDEEQELVDAATYICFITTIENPSIMFVGHKEYKDVFALIFKITDKGQYSVFDMMTKE